MIKGVKNIYKKLKKGESGVGLYYWSPNDHRGKENFGDYLSKVIVKKVVENKEKETGIKMTEAIKYNKKKCKQRLLAIGSIIHHADNQDTIWGSGVNGKSIGQKIDKDDLDVRMVRGPLTKKFLNKNGISCPPKYGEPGLLISKFFGKESREKKYPYSLVLNLNDVEFFEKNKYVILPNEGLADVVRKVRQSELVVSTSLHGIVIAEAFGIPARHLLSFAEPTFKYIDYYRGTGRSEVRFAHTLDEALDLGGVTLPHFDLQEMLNNFPFDLLERHI